MDENRVRQIISDEIAKRFGRGKFILPTTMQLLDGRNIQLGRTTGTEFGTAPDQKFGFFGTAPVAQQSAPTDTAGIIALLQAYGLAA
jgi:hypothetical protein